MVRLELLEPLPQLDPPPEGSGFFGVLLLVLADGQLCLPTGGATTDVAGERYDYECPDGRGYGEPDTRNPIWTLSYRAEGAAELVPVEVATAYQ